MAILIRHDIKFNQLDTPEFDEKVRTGGEMSYNNGAETTRLGYETSYMNGDETSHMEGH